MSMKTFSHQSEQRLKTSSWSQAPFFKKLRCLLVGSQHGAFHLAQLVLSTWESPRDGPWAPIVILLRWEILPSVGGTIPWLLSWTVQGGEQQEAFFAICFVSLKSMWSAASSSGGCGQKHLKGSGVFREWLVDQSFSTVGRLECCRSNGWLLCLGVVLALQKIHSFPTSVSELTSCG